MAQPIFGTGMILEMFITDQWYPILCATDCAYNRRAEFIEKTGPNSGLFREYAVRIEEWDMSASGLTKITNSSEALTFFYMLQTSVRRTEQQVRITFTDDEGGSKQITGNALIGDSTITGPATDWANCSIQLKGTGAFTISEVDPPSETEYTYLSDYWVVGNGNNYISGASAVHGYTLISTDIPLEVDWEGLGYELVSGTPATGARECRFTTSPVRITFPADLISTGVQRVFVFFKRVI